MTDPKPVQESAPPAAASKPINDCAYCEGSGRNLWSYSEKGGPVYRPCPACEGQPEAEAPRPPAAPSPEDAAIIADLAKHGIHTERLHSMEEALGEEPPRGAAAGEEIGTCAFSHSHRTRREVSDCIAAEELREDAQEVATTWLDMADRSAKGSAAKVESLTRLILGVRAQAREEGRKAGLEEAARVAKESSFDDGPAGTIEGQIAAAIRALGTKGEGGK